MLTGDDEALRAALRFSRLTPVCPLTFTALGTFILYPGIFSKSTSSPRLTDGREAGSLSFWQSDARSEVSVEFYCMLFECGGRVRLVIVRTIQATYRVFPYSELQYPLSRLLRTLCFSPTLSLYQPPPTHPQLHTTREIHQEEASIANSLRVVENTYIHTHN